MACFTPRAISCRSSTAATATTVVTRVLSIVGNVPHFPERRNWACGNRAIYAPEISQNFWKGLQSPCTRRLPRPGGSQRPGGSSGTLAGHPVRIGHIDHIAPVPHWHIGQPGRIACLPIWQCACEALSGPLRPLGLVGRCRVGARCQCGLGAIVHVRMGHGLGALGGLWLPVPLPLRGGERPPVGNGLIVRPGVEPTAPLPGHQASLPDAAPAPKSRRKPEMPL